MNNTIIVFGDDFWNTLGIIRSLGEVGQRPVFINVCQTLSWVKNSRYIGSYHQVRTVREGVELLCREYGGRKPKPVVFVSNDPAMSYIDAHYDQLKDDFILPNANDRQGEINRLMDKDVMLAIADSVGMTHPQCISIDLNIENDLSSIHYPCLTKPLYSVEGSKADIVRCNDDAELRNTLQQIRMTGCVRVQVQEYIEKEYEMLITGCSLPDGRVIVPGIITKLTEYPMGFTARACIEPDVERYIDPEIVKAYVRETGYVGVFSLEFLLQRGSMYFLEINLRNDGNSYAPTYGGVNIHDIWWRGMCGLPYHYPDTIRRRYDFQQESNALNYYHFLGGGYPKFFREFMSVDFHLHTSWRDPSPALHRFVINKLKHSRLTGGGKYLTLIRPAALRLPERRWAA